MVDESALPEKSFLRRWSQRKLAAAREARPVVAPAAEPKAAQPPATQPSSAAPAPAAANASPATEVALPPVESLSFDSDFTAFLSPKVDESVKRQALKKLFTDPRFNVMDGLDVYIDDYSKFEPIPEDVIAQLRHARYLFDPPKTRVNERGEVEDVPEEEVAGTVEAPDPSEIASAEKPPSDAAHAGEPETPLTTGGTAVTTNGSEASPGTESPLPLPPAEPAAPVRVSTGFAESDEPRR